jgi:uncharacterized protein (DUF1330 family)
MTQDLLDRLHAAYAHPTLDPSADAWAALVADQGFETQPIRVTEFVRLAPAADAAARYDAWLDALAPAIAAAGGEMLSINDTMFPGLDEPAGYDGGVSWVASFPAIRAYAEAMADERTVAAATQRIAALAEAYVLAGANLIPDAVRQMPPNEPASAFPSTQVQGKTPEEIVDALLRIYPAGGADPTRARLQAIVTHEGFADQRVHYINLYEFNQDAGGGEAALNEYNSAARPAVFAHGARPKALVNVTHHLVGRIAWDRFIFVSWPSLAVFTDLRLDPTYIEAQKSRLLSASRYGNLMTIARADRKPAPAAQSKGRGR